jgi:hypothetical protein
MAFNINDIKSQLTFGGARPTLFQVKITNKVNPVADIKVPFLVRATTLPASNLGTIQVPYFGRKYKIAGDRTFDPWGVTVMNDEDFLIRHAMEQWNYSINTYEGNLNVVAGGTAGTGAPSFYKSTAEVTQYSKTGQVLRVYRFNGIYPDVIGQIDLDWNNTDTIEEFQVQFQYDSFEVVGGVTGTLSDEGSTFVE